MWLFTRYGFYSIACARKPDGSLDPELLMVRARRKEHLANLQKRFAALAGAEIVRLPHRDYRYRLVVPKHAWVTVIAELAREQEWSNFKKEAERFLGAAGRDYTDALHQVWGVMYLQGK